MPTVSTKLSDISTLPSSLELEDLFYVVDDPTGTPSSWSLYLSTLKTAMVSSLQTSSGWITGLTTFRVAGNASSVTVSSQIVYGSTFSGQLATVSTLAATTIAASTVTASTATVGGSSVLVSGGALGTPSSGSLENCTGADQGTIDNSAVGQGELKSTTGEASASSATNATLPGGSYGFYPQIKATGGAAPWTWSIANYSSTPPSSYTTIIRFETGFGTLFAQQRYIQASPPYDMGDGEIPLFVFVMFDRSGKIIATYVAEDPPWANNGPTDIRPHGKDGLRRPFRYTRNVPLDLQLKLNHKDPFVRAEAYLERDALPMEAQLITREFKNSDMPLIPHPFLGDDQGKSIILIDPVSDFCEKLLILLKNGESIAEIVHEYLTIDNQPLSRKTPSGVIACSAKWK